AALLASILMRGTADDARFSRYVVSYTNAASTVVDTLPHGPGPVANGVLAGWNTRRVPDGNYRLSLVVADRLGLTGRVEIDVTVDNHAPFDSVTTPAQVTAMGGDVYTSDGRVHLYVPPHGFAFLDTVRIVER